MPEGQEFIWVSKEFADQYKQIESIEEKHKVFEEYLKTVTESSRKEFKANLENLDEDVAIYTGLMLKVKQAFEKAKNEQLSASYALWEKFDTELPSTKQKVDKLIEVLKPLSEKLNELNKTLKSIETYDIDRLIGVVEKLSSLYGTNKEMVEFLIKNFTGDK